MSIRSLAGFAAAVLCLGVAPRSLCAQQPDSVRASAGTAGAGSFRGRLVNAADSTPVQSADVRLLFVDSTRTVRDRRGDDSLEVFIDSSRIRLAVSNTAGSFVIRRLAEGHYLLNIRRIGFTPIQGVLSVDTGVVSGVFPMKPTSRVLSKVVITAPSVDRAAERLDRTGYLERSRSGLSASFIGRADILKSKRDYLGDVLQQYGITQADIMLDRMPLQFDDVRDYPMTLVLGIEIYRQNRPIEFDMTRRGPGVLDPGGNRNVMTPLVVVWTYIP